MVSLFTLLLVTLFLTKGDLEPSISYFSSQRCKRGVGLGYSWFDWYEVSDFVECARECHFIKMCKSWQYTGVQKQCLLNFVNSSDVNDGNFFENSDAIFCDRDDLSQVIAGTCSSAPCSLSEKCLPSKPHQCIKYCGTPTNPPHTERYTQCQTLACGNRFECHYALVPSKAGSRIMHSTCQENGNWSEITATCVDMTSCQKVLDCNPGYDDGEYWIVWESGSNTLSKKWVKIYCANMQGSGTPKEYLTLPVPSTMVHPGYKGYFAKTRIDMTTMTLDLADFLANNRSACMPQYGVFTADPNDCQASSYIMTLDMSGTGLLIKPLPDWQFTYGDVQPITVEYQPNTGEKTVLVYGNVLNNYGRVAPTNGIYVVLDESNHIPTSAATRPECV